MMVRLKPILLVAESYVQANTFMVGKGYRPKHWAYVGQVIDLYGFREANVVLTGTWYNRDDLAAIEDIVEGKPGYRFIKGKDLLNFRQALLQTDDRYFKEIIGTTVA